jgi:hypothetical protein
MPPTELGEGPLAQEGQRRSARVTSPPHHAQASIFPMTRCKAKPPLRRHRA